MKIIRDLKWKMIDRFPALDRKEHYRRPPEQIDAYRMPGPSMLDAWDKIAIAMVSMVLVGAGLFGLLLALFLAWALIAG